MNQEQREFNRRQFLTFMGQGLLAASSLSLGGSLLLACNRSKEKSLPFQPLSPTQKDEFILAQGLKYSLLIEWDQVINTKGERFGFNNDYTKFIPIDASNGIIWVNHEYADPLFVSKYDGKKPKTKAQVDLERKSVGGSILRIQKNPNTTQWEIIPNHPLNRRITAETKIPFITERAIAGSKTATGTLANCAGGLTPWGSILTCEENYQYIYGEIQSYQWERYYPNPTEHYGWVVEVNVQTGEAKKLTSLGRFSHESATVVQAKDGRCVVYSGDDANNECLYKFIADKKGSLHQGTLYAADTVKGRWISLDYQSNPLLKTHFKDQTDVLIHTRKAAKLLGATPLDRPEDIEMDPKTKAIFVALTNNKKEGNYYGSLLKIKEKNNDPLSLEFNASTFITGGRDSTLACPDNLAFDPKGNLWIANDISAKSINHGPYAGFGNNALFFCPMSGPNTGNLFQVASAPVNAELTGISFTPDGQTLFLSVQHPGELSPSFAQAKSHWPHGGNQIPKPAVVQIELATLL